MEDKNDRSAHGMRLGTLKGKRRVLLVAVVLMISALVILYAFAAYLIYKAVRCSLNNPLSYLMIGGFFVLIGSSSSFCGASETAQENISRNKRLFEIFPAPTSRIPCRASAQS